MTLLQIVQEILADMGSDNVNSINDTIEAYDVARIVASTYRELVDYYNVPYEYTLFTLESVGNPDRPTVMKLPSKIAHVEWIKYGSLDE